MLTFKASTFILGLVSRPEHFSIPEIGRRNRHFVGAWWRLIIPTLVRLIDHFQNANILSVGVGIAIAVPFIVFAFNINQIEKVWKGLLDQIKSILPILWKLVPKALRECITKKKKERKKRKLVGKKQKWKVAKDRYFEGLKSIKQDSTTEFDTSDSSDG